MGWSIADHLCIGLVIDALDMARRRHRPAAGQTVVHSDHGCQYILGLRPPATRRFGIPESRTVLDGAAIRVAGSRAQVL